MSVDVIAQAAQLVAATVAGIYGGTMEAVGDRVLDRTLEALNKARGKRAAEAQEALEEAKSAPRDEDVIRALAATLEALARINPTFSAQMQADSKRLSPSWVTIHAGDGANVIVNAGERLAAQVAVDDGDSGSDEDDKKFELSDSLKRAPKQIWWAASAFSRRFGAWALEQVPVRFKDTSVELAVVQGLIWLPRVVLLVVALVVLTPVTLFVNAVRDKDVQSLFAGAAVFLLIVIPITGVFSGGGAAASVTISCELRDTTHGSGEVVTRVLTDYRNYDLSLNTTIGPIVLSINAQDHPCEAFALHEAVSSQEYRNVMCDGLSYGMVSCWPDTISNQAKIFRVKTTGQTPNSDSYPSEETVLLKIDGDEIDASDWVTGLFAFVGDSDSSYMMSDNVVAIGTVVSGTNALQATIETGSHHEDDDFWKPSKLNKPFRITSVSVVAPDPNAEPSPPTTSPNPSAS